MTHHTQPRWDDLIADADWLGDDAEFGPYSLHRENGFVTIHEWVNNTPMLVTEVKG